MLSEVKGRHVPTVPAENIMPFMPICRYTVGIASQRNISKLYLYVMQITLKVKSASIISSFSPILALLQVSDKWLGIESGNSIRVYDANNSQIRSYEVCTYSLAHISSQFQDLRLGIIRKLILVFQLESGMAMSDVEFGHMIILCMMVCNTGVDMDEEYIKVSSRIGQDNWTLNRK